MVVQLPGRDYNPRPFPKSLNIPGAELPMPSVRVKQDEPFDLILRRFRRSCEKAGIFTESRRREYYEKPTSIRKRKAAAAVKREKKRVSRQNVQRGRLY